MGRVTLATHLKKRVEKGWSETQMELDDYYIQKQQEDHDSYLWNYTIRPSSYDFTFGECPEDYIAKTESAPVFDIELLWIMDQGTGMHDWIQQRIMNIPGKLYGRPKYQSIWQTKYAEECWPEVPVWGDLFAGHIDQVYMRNGRPAPVDYKFVIALPEQGWEAIKDTAYPKTTHYTQIGIYTELLIEGKVFDKDPVENALIYIHKPLKPWKEIWQPYDDIYRGLTRNIMAGYRSCVGKRKRKEDFYCDYVNCHKHGKYPFHAKEEKDRIVIQNKWLRRKTKC